MKFKNKRDKELFFLLHPALILIYADMYNYAYESYGIELTVTDTISTPKRDKKLGRKSLSHQRALAIDIRTKDIDAIILQDIVDYINYKPEYKKYRYVSFSGSSRLAYIHVGNAEHCHLAIHSRFANN